MKKVLLLAEQWKPERGGVQRYLRGIVDSLNEYEIEVVTHHPSASQSSAPPLGKGRKVTYKKLFYPLLKPAWLPLFMWLFRRAKRGEFDVLLCGKGLFEGLVGYYLKKRLGIPYIVFTYAMEIETWARSPREKRKLMRVLESADAVVYINDVTKQALLDSGVREEQLVKVAPGVDPPTPRVSHSVTHAGESARRYVLAVGRLIERKGFDTLIEAFSQLDQVKFGDVELLIVGDGPERERLDQVAEEHWINESVKFLGEVSDEELEKLYAGAEVFALTPRDVEGDIEGFGIVYLEAAKHGVPAVATRTGGVPEAVLDDETGILVEPSNPEAVAAALMRLLENKEQRDELGEYARRRVIEEFSWQTRIEPLKRVLQAL